ncbi:Disease resistance-like protein DSC1 [Citrus sinensis]|nr:Disease resistance-like protein DSC1 [Citrus sinensis]
MEHLNQISLGRTTVTEQLPSSFENVEGLETPGLEDCSEPDEIGNFNSHEYVGAHGSAISLRHCALTAVLQEIGCTSTLEWLHLRANNFESLPACIEQRSRLTNLALCGRNMPQSLTELPLISKLPSSMASSSSASSLDAQNKYEVFLSFRGEDTRNGFTSHLAAALHRKQIQFFIDDEELKKGDEISPALSNAIETTDISIIIFSKGYASSKWCLNELVKTLDCKRTNGQIVIPVFYQIDPSDVRKQSESLEEAFLEHEKNFPDKVQKWRAALTEASNLSGYDPTESRNEAELVEEIVADISKKLEDMSDSTDLDGFIGINSRIEEIKSLLCLESHDARIVGIWGMGGIGKTTIASVVFHQISRYFQGNCFMANVREESNKLGVIRVRDEVISQVLGENLKVGTLTIPQNIKKGLQRMKVLIVLDDVHDEFTQLESLAGVIDRFSPGSRIIITTRDKRVLDKCEVSNIFEVKGLEHNKAFELFCRKAFGQNNRSHDLYQLSQRVVCYADGNPLALEVLGSSLYQNSIQQWEDKLHNLNLISEPNIYKVLKISYDELNSEEKGIFLDIACFFKGEDVDLLTRIQDNPTSMCHRLKILVGKSLIAISDRKRLQMHDLLQEMGQTIVRQESLKEPEFPQISGNITNLHLRETAIEEVPSSIHCLTNLKKLSLINCTRLKRVSTIICKLKSLLELYLRGCLRLESCPDILEKMEHLNHIALERTEITEPPFSFENLEGLETLGFEGFSEQGNSPVNIGKLSSSDADSNELKQLWLRGTKCLVSYFASSLSGLSPLASLDISDCALTTIPQDIGCLSSLKYFFLRGNKFEDLPASIKQLSQLIILDLSRCNMLQSLPELPPRLKWLDATDCKRLQSLPQIASCLEELDSSVLEKLSKHSHEYKNYFWLNSWWDKDSSSIEFMFSNCLKLNKNANNKNLADSQVRIQHMAIASLRLFYELEVGHCKLGGPSMILPRSEIPEWFINQSSGSEITLQLPQHCCQNLIGFALCAILETSAWTGDGFHVGCEYSFEMNTLSERKHVGGCCYFGCYSNKLSDQVMLGISPLGNVGFSDDNHHTTVSFKFSSDSQLVVRCGVCPVYVNANKTKPNSFTLKFVTEIWKLDDMARGTGTPASESGNEEFEPTPKRICRDHIHTP